MIARLLGLALLCGALAPPGLADVRCLPDAPASVADTLGRLRSELADCAAAAPDFFTEFAARPPRLCLDDSPLAPRGAYEPAQHRIVLNANLDPGARLLVALHEIRHLSQMSRGLCPSPQMSRNAYVEATLALEADAMANAIAVAWELAQKGRDAAWHAAREMGQYGDIAAAFSDATEGPGEPLSSAVSAAYAQWFASPWRVDTYRNAACLSQLDQRDAQHLLPLYAPLPETFFERLCRLPDGTAYDCAAPR